MDNSNGTKKAVTDGLCAELLELEALCEREKLDVVRDGDTLRPAPKYTHGNGWSMHHEHGSYIIRLHGSFVRSTHKSGTDCVYTMQSILGIH